MLLQNKNVIITGTNRGIGRAMVQAFAENGSNIWACARKETPEFVADMKNIEKETGVWIKPLYFDLSDEQQIKDAIKLIIKEKLPVDALVNNAGVTYNALFQMTSMERMREVFDINFFSMFLFTQYVVRLMVKNKSGSIINIASSAAIDANSGRSAYGSSKAAVICTTKAIAEELGSNGIRANAIAPGITDTDMVGQSMTNEVIEGTVLRNAIKRMGKPSEIANVAVFLASDKSSYITGQVFRVDGGM